MRIDEAKKQSGLSDNEFKASVGVLKKRGLIELKKEKIIFNADKEEISKKSPEESLLESLPLEYNLLNSEQLSAFKSLEKRKEIVEVNEEEIVNIKITNLGKRVVETGIKRKNLIEQVTSERFLQKILYGKEKNFVDMTWFFLFLHSAEEKGIL